MGIAENLEKVRKSIAQAAQRASRPLETIQLIAVSKGQTVQTIEEAWAAGQTVFGENYVQELMEKKGQLPQPIQWHFIGKLQKNKINKLLPHITLLQTLDSWDLAAAVHERLTQPLDCLLEVNVAGEKSKSGCAPEVIPSLLEKIGSLEKIGLKGLMTIPPPQENPEASRPFFRTLKNLLQRANREGWYRQPLTELSMGMSHDYPIAIAEGATIIRIGTAIFGSRL